MSNNRLDPLKAAIADVPRYDQQEVVDVITTVLTRYEGVFLFAVDVLAERWGYTCREDTEIDVLRCQNAKTEQDRRRAHSLFLKKIVMRIDAAMEREAAAEASSDAPALHHGDAAGQSDEEPSEIGSRETAAQGVREGKPKRGLWAWLRKRIK